jgi:hypothetical protein
MCIQEIMMSYTMCTKLLMARIIDITVSDLIFFVCTLFFTNKTDCHYINEILLNITTLFYPWYSRYVGRPMKISCDSYPMRGVLDTTLCDNVCQWFAAVLWFSSGTPVSCTNKTDHYDITEILLKVAQFELATLVMIDTNCTGSCNSTTTRIT